MVKWAADNIVKLALVIFVLVMLFGLVTDIVVADTTDNDEFILKMKFILDAINSFASVLFPILISILVYFFKRINTLEKTLSDSTTKLAVACADIASRDTRLSKVESDIDRIENRMMNGKKEG